MFAEQQPHGADEGISFGNKATQRGAANLRIITDTLGLPLTESPRDIHILASKGEVPTLAAKFHKETPRTYSIDQPQSLWPLRRNDEALLLQHLTIELSTMVDFSTPAFSDRSQTSSNIPSLTTVTNTNTFP